jgi:hypothetical protein
MVIAPEDRDTMDALNSALWALRIRKHATTGYSPFYLVYGCNPVLPGDDLRPYVFGDQDDDMVARRTAEELEALGQARGAAEYRMKSQADKDKDRWDAVSKHVVFDVGELVLLRVEQKVGLEMNWEGPYRVFKKNAETDVYWLETLGGVLKNDWVHVDRLKKAATVDELLGTRPWFEVAASRAQWPAGALRDATIIEEVVNTPLDSQRAIQDLSMDQVGDAAFDDGPIDQDWDVEEAEEEGEKQIGDSRNINMDFETPLSVENLDAPLTLDDETDYAPIDEEDTFDVDLEPPEPEEAALDSDASQDIDARGRTIGKKGGIVSFTPVFSFDSRGVPNVVPAGSKRRKKRSSYESPKWQRQQ